MWKMPRDSQPPDDCARFLPPGFTGTVCSPVTVSGTGLLAYRVRHVREYLRGECTASYNIRIRRPRR